jgi:hypothetical protein
MLKIVNLITLLLFSFNLLGQNNLYQIEATEKSKENLQKLLAVLDDDNFSINSLNSQRQKYYFEIRKCFERYFEKGLKQTNFEITNYFTDFYSLNIIEINDTVINLKLYTTEDILFEKKSDEQEELINSHDDFIFYFPTELYEYGTFCGITGTPPEKCIEMLKFISEKNYSMLSEWLYSQNPEITVYGYVGLSFLRKKGMKINQTETIRMEQIKSSNIQLYTCDGCFYGVQRTIQEVLNEDILDKNYSAFMNSGWLR